MDRLPIEVMRMVFDLLELEDRIACTLVCRNWWRALDEFSLFNSVLIDYDEQLFMRFMEMVNRTPYRATQVEDLYLITCIQADFNKRTLLNTFPNLRSLKVEYYGSQPSAQIYFNEPIHITQSVSKLRILQDGLHCEIASQVLASNLGGKLEELYLSFGYIRSISTRTLLDQLNNLPVLNRLILHSLDLGINDLENIHRYLPSIKRLSLYKITIVDNRMPVSITPVASITSLNIGIDRAANVNTHIQFYQYITNKYRNADDVSCDELNLNLYQADDIERVYLNGILDFYKMAVPKKKTLSIRNVPLGLNVFDVFDQVQCQLEEMSVCACPGEVLEHLSQSNQAKSIRKLRVGRSNISSIHYIKTMPVLTNLKLLFYLFDNPPAVNLTDCLNACPITLKEFWFSCSNMILDISNIQLNNIETLELHCDIIDSNLGGLISSSFPKLVNLALHGEMRENICIILHNPYFQAAKFCLREVNSYGVTFKAPNQPVPQHYSILGNDCHLVEYQEICHLPILTVTSFTEKKLDIKCDAVTYYTITILENA